MKEEINDRRVFFLRYFRLNLVISYKKLGLERKSVPSVRLAGQSGEARSPEEKRKKKEFARCGGLFRKDCRRRRGPMRIFLEEIRKN